MQIISNLKEMQQIADDVRLSGKKIGLVPTMGFLHNGHLSLVKESKKVSDFTVVSVFVNPAQFGPTEDFKQYPRDFEKDTNLLQEEGVDVVFFPDAKEIYPEGFQTYVEVSEISKMQEGEFRPTHFKGVTTIVSILFNVVKPHYAFFGQKDAQQAAILKRMVKDLKFDIKINVMPIVREEDGLALSSRNIFLKQEDRTKALLLYKSINEAKDMIVNGERNAAAIIKKVNNNFLKEVSVHLNYIRIVEEESFIEAEILKPGNTYYILIACRIGQIRLIDNLKVSI